MSINIISILAPAVDFIFEGAGATPQPDSHLCFSVTVHPALGFTVSCHSALVFTVEANSC